MRIAVVGAGIAGLSLAWALHKRGAEVAVFEQGPIPNPIASSFDEHRITRHTYGGLSGYGALMPQAFAIYEELWADLGVRHLHPTKLVYLGRQESDWYATSAEELDAAGIAHRALTRSDLDEIVPMMRLDGVVDAFEADGAGELFASRIVTDLAKWLREAGVELHEHSRVSDVDANAGRLTAGGVVHHADIVVVAAGAWVRDLVPTAIRLTPSRQTLLYLKPPASLEAAWRKAPIIVDTGVTHGAYILPPKDGTRLKIGDHVFTRRGQGDDDRIATPEDIAPVAAAARDCLADFDSYSVLEHKVCYYTVTADERFVVEPLGPAAWLLSACSGHGFKLGPLIASGLADTLVGRRDTATLPAWAAGLAGG